MGIDTAFRDNVLIVSVGGDIDHHSAKGIREDIDRQILEKLPKCVVLDLSQTEFMDSSGLGLILGRFRKTQELGIDFKLVNPSERVMTILAMAGVEKLIKIEVLSTK